MKKKEAGFGGGKGNFPREREHPSSPLLFYWMRRNLGGNKKFPPGGKI